MPQQAARVQWQPKGEPNLRGTQAAGCESRTDLTWKLEIDVTRVRTLYLSIWRQRLTHFGQAARAPGMHTGMHICAPYNFVKLCA